MPHSSNSLNELCGELLGYAFQDAALLKRCLSHSSYANTRLDSNERLEYLGDAVLGLVVSEMLFHRFPEATEGEMTRVKSSLVSRKTCADICDRLELDQCILLGRGFGGGSEIPPSIRAALVEALIAGVYLDGGLEAARDCVERMIEPYVQRTIERRRAKNHKSLLQQLAQKTFGETPVYRVLDEKGPDHSKCFEIAAVIGNATFPPAWGASKKEAEQLAASNAIEKIEGDEES